ncbi:MAG: chemotaxis protein CheA [Steroidobacteraceae bacterium]
MNDFLNQFLIESREIVQQATDGLLKLERAPEDTELLDAVFRAFHTLKGGAGIVEFAAMERAVHAAESVLSDARSGTLVPNAERVGDCLNCLDQVIQWLDTLEQTGELPASAEPAADSVVRRFNAAAAGTVSVAAAGGADSRAWAARMLARHSALATPAATAIRFVPDPDCFYQGEDPVARMTSLPKLLAMELEPTGTAQPLSQLDVYRCNLIITALSAAPLRELNEHMSGCCGEWQAIPADTLRAASRGAALSLRAREILAAQLALLRDTQPRNFVGRVASAGLTAANVLRSSGLEERAAVIAAATEQCIAKNATQPLADLITAILAGPDDRGTGAPEPARRADATNRTLRVDAARIDALVRLTSELTVAKNALGHLARIARAQGNALAASLKDRHGVLQHLISELQTQVLGIRVLPLRSVLQRLPRLVREMSSNLGKPVQLQIEGEETEADKAIVEMLFEPLLHIVRNAIDHGVESPTVRAARGKPAMASLHIVAARQGDQVLIEIRDDGGGVDVERVRQVAQERSVASEERLRAMTETEIVELIFAPGFSTAPKLTELSGRGVGMDAVRTSVERVGGRVALESRARLGTTIRIFLPFSVMMTRVMTVEAGEQIFGIPLDAIVETIRVPTESIAKLGAAQAIVVRDRIVPVLELARSLGIACASQSGAETTIVVTSSAGQFAGVQVDRVGEQMEVILQPLDGLLSGTPGITGTTLLGDGRVLLVLDMGAMLQ